MRIGINGFGRIGRNFTKALLERYPEMEIAAVNDLTSAAECAHLFKYDSNYGTYTGEVQTRGDALVIDGKPMQTVRPTEPLEIPVVDLRGQAGDEQEIASQRILKEESRFAFDLVNGTLARPPTSCPMSPPRPAESNGPNDGSLVTQTASASPGCPPGSGSSPRAILRP